MEHETLFPAWQVLQPSFIHFAVPLRLARFIKFICTQAAKLFYLARTFFPRSNLGREQCGRKGTNCTEQPEIDGSINLKKHSPLLCPAARFRPCCDNKKQQRENFSLCVVTRRREIGSIKFNCELFCESIKRFHRQQRRGCGIQQVSSPTHMPTRL